MAAAQLRCVALRHPEWITLNGASLQGPRRASLLMEGVVKQEEASGTESGIKYSRQAPPDTR